MKISFALRGLAVIGLTAAFLVAAPLSAQAATCGSLSVPIKVELEGAYNSGTGLMSDALLTSGVLPTTEPYSGLGYVMRGGETNTTTAPSSPVPTDGTAVVDWILVELRDATDPTKIIATDTVTLEQNGLTTSAPTFAVKPGNYYVAIEHRNHLGVMTAAPVAIGSSNALIDFSTTAPVYELASPNGAEVRSLVGGVELLRGGDANGDHQVAYTSDSAAILAALGNNTNAVVNGYYRADLNMNGVIRYAGPGNDPAFLLSTALGGSTTQSYTEQLPTATLGTASVCTAPAITLAALPGGATGTAYSHAVTTTGDPTMTFAATGALPPGLSLDPATGIISGTPTTAGTYSFTVTATNGSGSDSHAYTLAIIHTLASTGTDLAPGLTVGGIVLATGMLLLAWSTARRRRAI